MPDVVRVTITKNTRDEWVLLMTDENRVPDEDGVWQVLGAVGLNKSISRYLRSTLAMIEDELPGDDA